MKFWASLIGYQLVWFAAVIGAGRGLAWPGIVAALLYAAGQLAATCCYKTDLSLMAAAMAMGLLLDSGLIQVGLARFAAPGPITGMTPAWILGLWVAFSLTFTQSLAYLQTRLWLAALLGGLGGPLGLSRCAARLARDSIRSPLVACPALPQYRLGTGDTSPRVACEASVGRCAACIDVLAGICAMNPWMQMACLWALAASLMSVGWLWQRRRGNAGIVDVLWAARSWRQCDLLRRVGGWRGLASLGSGLARRPMGCTAGCALMDTGSI